VALRPTLSQWFALFGLQIYLRYASSIKQALFLFGDSGHSRNVSPVTFLTHPEISACDDGVKNEATMKPRFVIIVSNPCVISHLKGN
jgi:hypothetical protein